MQIIPGGIVNIPEDLQSEPNWSGWEYVEKVKRPMKLTDSGKFWGSIKRSEDWGSFDDAWEMVFREGLDGLAFNLTEEGCGYTVIDIDDCRDKQTGEMNDIAVETIELFNSYTEVSPSGEGVKIWVKSVVPGDWSTNNGTFEVYSCRRYLTVTGDAIMGYQSIKDRYEVLEEFLNKHMQRGESVTDAERFLIGNSEIDESKVASALEHIDPNCDYDRWVKVGMALHHCSADWLSLWDNWSSGGASYPGLGVLKQKWESFSRSSGVMVTIGSIYEWAKENGWQYKPNEDTYGVDDFGMSLRVRDRIKGMIHFCPDLSGWLVWDGKQFAESAGEEVTDAIHGLATELIADHPWTDAKELARFKSRYGSIQGIEAVSRLIKQRVFVRANTFDQNPAILPCENCVLEFGEFAVPRAFKPEDLNTKRTHVAYDQEATCPRWVQFIEEITCQDASLGRYLQKIVGLSLTGFMPGEEFYALLGEGGNGKTVFINLIHRLLGPYAVKIKAEVIMEVRRSHAHETSTAALRGARFAYCEETDESTPLKEAAVKEICSPGTFRARNLYGREFEFPKTAKLMLGTNYMPFVRGSDNGIWRRLRVVPFNADFSEKGDKHLEAKLVNELPGILNWAIEGYRLWKIEKLEPPEKIVSAIRQHREDMDYIGMFIEDELTQGEGTSIERSVLWENFRFYCQQNGNFTPRSIKGLIVRLEKLGCSARQVRDGGTRKRVVSGVRLRDFQ